MERMPLGFKNAFYKSKLEKHLFKASSGARLELRWFGGEVYNQQDGFQIS